MATRSERLEPGSPPPDDGDRELEFGRVYQEMRALARRLLGAERAGHTLQATALVNEAWLRLNQGAQGEPANANRFRRNAALAMRQILVDHARRHASDKRGGGAARIPLDALALASQGLSGDLLAIDEAITRLEQRDAALAELVRLRFFAGLEMEKVADVLGRSVRSVNRDWSYAKAILARELSC